SSSSWSQPDAGAGLAWGEEDPYPEVAFSWEEWTKKGDTGDPANITGPFGALEVVQGREDVSGVKDLGDVSSKYLQLITNKYEKAYGRCILQWRGQATPFVFFQVVNQVYLYQVHGQRQVNHQTLLLVKRNVLLQVQERHPLQVLLVKQKQVHLPALKRRHPQVQVLQGVV
ncbi:MAG: hypothetical protein ACXACB_01985, partial [Promethearchaeota archaeon]